MDKIKNQFLKWKGKIIAITFGNNPDNPQNVRLIDFNDNWFKIQYVTGGEDIINRNIVFEISEGDKEKFEEYYKKYKKDPTFIGDADLGYKVIKKNVWKNKKTFRI